MESFWSSAVGTANRVLVATLVVSGLTGIGTATGVATAQAATPAALPAATAAGAGYGADAPVIADPTTSAQHAAERTVVDVTAFGADPTGRSDSAAAVAAAVAHARDLEGPTTIVFPTGTYQIYPEKTEKRELYVSNTTGADSRFRIKNIAVLIEDMSDVIVDGRGSQLVFHGAQTQFATIRSRDVTVTGFRTDWFAPATVDITVVASGVDNGVPFRTVQVPPGTRSVIDGQSAAFLGENSPSTGQPYWRFDANGAGNGWNQVRRLATGETVRSGAPLWQNAVSVSEAGDNRLRIAYRGDADPGGVGDVYEMRNRDRDHPAIFAFQSTNSNLEDLELGYLHGFGVVAQLSTNVTVDGVRFRGQEGTWRQSSGFADHLQMSGVAGKVQILNSLFDNPHDDPINVHGTYVQVKGVDVAARSLTLEYMHGETAGFPQFAAGDSLRLVDRGTMTPNGEPYTVTAVSGPSGYDHDGDLTRMTVTLDRAPEGASVDGTVAENLTHTPEVHIAGNSFLSVPTRGILVTTPKPVLIERNLFDQVSMASIYVSGDARSWYESGGVEDLTIRQNVFDRPATGSPVISFDPTNDREDGARTVHRDILIEDNSFNLLPGTRLIDAKSVSDVVVRGNRIGWYGPTVDPDPTRVSAAALYSFTASRRITLEDNEYAAGMNVRVNTASTASSEFSGDDGFALDRDAFVVAPTTPLVAGLSWVREDATRWAPVDRDAVRLFAGADGLWATQNAAPNLLLRDAGAAAPTEAIVRLEGATASAYEEAGLVVYLGDDDYVALHRKHAGGSPVLAVVTEEGGAPDESVRVPAPSTGDVWLKLTRSGSQFIGSYSTDGTEFTPIGTVTNASAAAPSARVGVMASGATSQGTSFVLRGLRVDGDEVGFFDEVPAVGRLAAGLGEVTWNGVAFGDPVAARSWLASVPVETSEVRAVFRADESGTALRVTLNGRRVAVGADGAVDFPLAAGPNIVEVRTLGADGDSQTYRWAVVSLRPGDPTRTVAPEARALDVDITVGTRCVAKKAVVTVQVSNQESQGLAVTVTSDFGTKSFAAVGAGSRAAHAFTTRLTELPAGSITVTASGTVGGTPVTETLPASYSEAACR